MSIRVMTAVWDRAPFSEGTLLVLLALADWSNDEGTCWPSVPAIAKKARLSESGAKYALRRLQDAGEITWEAGDGRGHTSRYQISSQYLTPFKIKGSVDEDKGVSKAIPNKEEPSLEPSRIDELLPTKPENPDVVIERVFQYYLARTRKNPLVYTLTPLRLKKAILRYRELLARVKGNQSKAEELLKIAVDAIASSDFHMGNNTQKTKYNDWIDHLFKSRETTEKWLEQS